MLSMLLYKFFYILINCFWLIYLSYLTPLVVCMEVSSALSPSLKIIAMRIFANFPPA